MRTRMIAPVLGLALLAGCTSAPYKVAEKTNMSLGDTKTELLTDKTTLKQTVDDLNDLVYHPATDLRPQYKKFADDVTALDKSVTASRKSAKGMTENRESYLADWRAQTAVMSDTDLRMRAMERIKQVEANFSVVSDKLVDADNAIEPVLSKLKSLSVYIGGDLTTSGLNGITDQATGASNEAVSVNQKIDLAVKELDRVSDQIAPVSTQPAS